MSSPASRFLVRSVNKDFGYQNVLREVTLSIEEGEFVALVGANGAGKTTLLRILAGLSRPTSGSVSLADVDLRRAGPGLRRRIGYVSHESLLYPDLTGRENLAFHARLFGVADPGSTITDLARLLDLDTVLDRPAGELSRGNRQRLSIARALLHGPRVLLLDEPFTGLDEESASRLLSILRAVVASGRTVVMSTHDRTLVESGPTRVIRLQEGTVVEDRPQLASASTPVVQDFPQPALEMPPTLARAALAVAAKDLRVELRTRDVVGSAGLFALCVLITASFTAPANETASGAATGVLWISLLFATLLATGRSMSREQSDRGIEGMLLAPVPRSAVFLGKAAATSLLMAVLALVVVVLFLVFMAGSASIDALALMGVVAVGILGLVVVASLLSGLAIGSRLGETLLPMLVMPVVVPLMVGSVELTRSALGGGAGGVGQWLAILAGFDVAMLVTALATFVFVIED